MTLYELSQELLQLEDQLLVLELEAPGTATGFFCELGCFFLRLTLS